MLLRQPFNQYGNLRNCKYNIYYLQSRRFRRIRNAPGKHIGVYRDFSGCKPESYAPCPVFKRITRAVGNPQHISVIHHNCPDIILTKFYHYIRLQFSEACKYFA